MAFSLSYIYRIIDKYSGPLAKIHAANEKFKAGVKKSSVRMGKMKNNLSSLSSAAAAAGAAIGGKVMLDKFVGFDSAMNKLESVTFAGEEQMASMRDMAKELGATTKFTASDAAEGMTYLAMAGLSTDKVLQAIPGTLQLAAAGGLELGQAADIATNVLGQMGMEVEELTRVNDVLALAQSKANFNITELFEAMRPVGTTAKNLGIDLEELTSYLGAMANAGEKGSIAGTLLRNAFTELAAPSEKQIKQYKKLGLNLGAFITKSGKIKNFKYLITELRRLNKEGKLSVGALQQLYGDRGFRAMQILSGKAGEGISQLEKDLRAAAGSAERAAQIQMKGLPGVLASMASAFEAVNIAIFESGLDDFLKKVFIKITLWARALSSSNPEMLKFIGFAGLITTALAGVLGVLTILGPGIATVGTILGGLWSGLVAFGPLLMWIGSTALPAIGTAAAAIAAPFALFLVTIASVGAAVYQVWKNWDYLVMDFKAGLVWISNLFDPVLNKVEALITFPQKLGGKVGSKIADFFGFGKEKGIAAENANAANSTLNGSITVAAEKGTSVTGTSMETSVPGNLGFNYMGMGGIGQ